MSFINNLTRKPKVLILIIIPVFLFLGLFILKYNSQLISSVKAEFFGEQQPITKIVAINTSLTEQEKQIEGTFVPNELIIKFKPNTKIARSIAFKTQVFRRSDLHQLLLALGDNFTSRVSK